MTSLLIEFISDFISPLKTMSLHITFGDEPCSKMMMTKFIVVDTPSSNNAIISQPILNRLRVVVLTYHMMIKFSIKIDIGELKSNPRELR